MFRNNSWNNANIRTINLHKNDIESYNETHVQLPAKNKTYNLHGSHSLPYGFSPGLKIG